MTTLLFAAGLAAAVAGIALIAIPAAAIVLGLALMTVAVLIERGRDAAATPGPAGDAAPLSPPYTTTRS